MSGEQKVGVWCFALFAAMVIVITVTTGLYYHGKDQRQGARGKANVDLVCNLKEGK